MTPDEYTEAYSAVCDVVYRTQQGWPLNDGDDLRHTSDDARRAANRIFEIMLPAEEIERHRQDTLRWLAENPEIATRMLAYMDAGRGA